jgi:phosphoribosylglycinamide formyltransferase 2
VTLITQSQSEFALHVRAVLGLPLGFIFYGEGASAAFKSTLESHEPVLSIKEEVFSSNSFVRVFGKPQAHVGRRMAVVLVFDKIKKALKKAEKLVGKIKDL